jgi:hypothetical protein
MKQNILLGLTIAGLLFSGYLSGVKLFDGTCAFNESCPFFLGYPTCYYGFAMYLVMFVSLILLRMGKMSEVKSLQRVLGVSILGIFFAGYYSVSELSKLMGGSITEYFLGLPTCAYGLIVYIAIFGVTLSALCNKKT